MPRPDLVPPQAGRNICREAAVVWKAATGKGPLSARAFTSENVLVIVFEGVLTKMELEVLASAGPQRVRELRRSLFSSHRQELIDLVEKHAGFTVRTVLYDVVPTSDTSAFTFILDERASA